MPEPQCLGDPVIPVKELRVYLQEFPARHPPSGRVEIVQGLVNQLAELSEALVDRAHVIRLLIHR